MKCGKKIQRKKKEFQTAMIPPLSFRRWQVSTVGHNEAAVRLYIREQEKEDQRLDQLGLFAGQSCFERLQD